MRSMVYDCEHSTHAAFNESFTFVWDIQQQKKCNVF